jgi:hypothetical protein
VQGLTDRSRRRYLYAHQPGQPGPARRGAFTHTTQDSHVMRGIHAA